MLFIGVTRDTEAASKGKTDVRTSTATERRTT
jgi:hypothetical protein